MDETQGNLPATAPTAIIPIAGNRRLRVSWPWFWQHLQMAQRLPESLDAEIFYRDRIGGELVTPVWQPIETRPERAIIDVLAKKWAAGTDMFVFHRFVNCRFTPGNCEAGQKSAWHGLEDGWRAVAWMYVPPLSYP